MENTLLRKCNRTRTQTAHIVTEIIGTDLTCIPTGMASTIPSAVASRSTTLSPRTHSGASSSRSRAHNNAFPGFTDPFTLFDSIFGDMRRQFDDPFFADARSTAGGSGSFGNPFGTDPFGHGSLFDRMTSGHHAFGMLPPANGMFSQSSAPFQSQSHSMNFQSSSRGGLNGDGQWVSQSRITRSVNGVTESVWKRTDASVS